MIKPLNDRIFIKRIEKATKTDGGIIIPDTSDQESMEGTVVAVGPGRYENGARVPLVVKKGDKVIFTKWASKDIVIDDVEYAVMNEEDIIGILA